ncbi:hypothetical protein KI387_015227, partial [Taxus chinensis]
MTKNGTLMASYKFKITKRIRNIINLTKLEGKLKVERERYFHDTLPLTTLIFVASDNDVKNIRVKVYTGAFNTAIRVYIVQLCTLFSSSTSADEDNVGGPGKCGGANTCSGIYTWRDADVSRHRLYFVVSSNVCVPIIGVGMRASPLQLLLLLLSKWINKIDCIWWQS